jgi:hypothetical protein
MRRLALLVCALAVAVACGSTARVRVAAHRPAAPKTWPPYPRFSEHACWARPSPGGATGVMRFAPSIVVARPLSEAEIVRGLLARFGDRRYLRRIELGPVPRLVLQHHGYFGDARPPADARWVWLQVRDVGEISRHPRPAAVIRNFVAGWERDLAIGGLRDDFCAAGGAPLVGWSVNGRVQMVSDSGDAFGQRFPNPTPVAFRTQLDRVARRYGFRVVSLRMLRPRQLAPLLVVQTRRDRTAFVHDLQAIVKLLNPTAPGKETSAATFEGFALVAEDARGRPFGAVEQVLRGEVQGGQWSANPCEYPYVHSEPFGRKPRCAWPG